MGDEGHFRFTNGTAVDEKLDKKRLLDVANHEFTHGVLYSTTSYGQFIMMLEKNGIADVRSKVVMETMFSYLDRMQERAAVNIELMLKCSANGMTEYFNAVNSLKERNNVYYNHFRKLCCINGKIEDTEDAEQLANILREIARLALNVDLNQIPFNSFETEKDVIRFFNNPKNNSRFSPNKRFDIIINVFFRENDNNNDFDAIYEGSIKFDKMDDVDYAHEVALQAIKDMYVGRPWKERLVRRAESVGTKKVMQFDGAELLAVKPAKINEDRSHFIKQIGSMEEFVHILNEQENKYVYIMNRIRGFEEFQVFCIYEERDDKRTAYSFGVFEEDNKTLFKMLESLECKFIFYKTKFMRKENSSVRRMVRQLPIYIFEDTPLLSTLEVIGQMYFGGKYSFIRRTNDSIIVFQKKSIILFANIVPEAEEVLCRELKRYNMEHIADDKLSQLEEILYLDKMCSDYEGNSIEDGKLI